MFAHSRISPQKLNCFVEEISAKILTFCNCVHVTALKVSFVFVPSREMVPQKRRKRGSLRRQKRASFNFKNWFHNHIDLSPSRLTQIGTGMGITTSSSLSQLGSIPPTHLKTKKRDQNLAIGDIKKWHDYNVYTLKGCVGLKGINLGGSEPESSAGLKINEARHNTRRSVQSGEDLKMRIVRVANCATLWSDCIITPQSWGRVLNVNDHAIEKSTSYLPEM